MRSKMLKHGSIKRGSDTISWKAGDINIKRKVEMNGIVDKVVDLLWGRRTDRFKCIKAFGRN